MPDAMKLHTVLVVDDEDRLRRALQKTLGQQEGCRTLSAASGEEAVAAMKRERVDLVITDLVMPGMGGLELVRQAKSQSPNLKAIIITAYGSPHSEAEAEDLGVDSYLAKPFDLVQLKSKVNELLQTCEPSENTLGSSCTESCLPVESRLLCACCSRAGRVVGVVTRVSRRVVQGLDPRNVLANAGRASRAVAGVCVGIQEVASGLTSKNTEVNKQ